ncbi:MAG: glutathione S-transferase family protein [Alphaproteobacteria bacterium]|nr:glutathione S-transferase family protein [Alphaproteobacteria bacterium]MBU0796309.1 glutathione S-transferase family protein [Alphaproteobacteria bacterium]MBU0889174.1 glutathione S-transferase family protein [Alphaproteobacteria bacterium]MBU1812208.1 glutathione S-transferase family protein [Alphaproteobacteria bacterium]MBU2091804.1 glutathione S-transferase family protein [Alphaproteobacteria bacterium]
MGMLVDGKWKDVWYDTKSTGGAFKRQDSSFRGQVTADGSSGFKAEAGRYHLYVSLACPWAHRTLIFRKLKGLDKAITLSIVSPLMLEEGWVFDDTPGTIPDSVNGAKRLHEVYTRAKPDYTGRVTVPVLWDKQTNTIVNNESAEIIRMLNSEFNAVAENPDLDFYPEAWRDEIEAINPFVYDRINNGVYKAGFATEQPVYEQAVTKLFEALDELEKRLTMQRYLAGDRLTEADWRLFTTLVRFDPVYVGHFKCNLRSLASYPNLWAYTRELYQVPGVAMTVDFDHIKGHYYRSHKMINGSGIVPKGPILDFTAPHDRERLPKAA